jgi:glutamate racemase
MATTRTVSSPRFRRLLDNHASHLEVHAQACPGLAEAIETHGPESNEVAALLDRFVSPLSTAGVDVVALGCTHYPWVARAIARRLPPEVQLLDTGEAIARQLERMLAASNLLGGGSGQLQLATSGAVLTVKATVERLWAQNGGEHLPVEFWEP